MMNDLLADFIETGILGEIWDITMHFAINFYILDDILPVCLKPTVKVMQIFYA